MTSGARCAPCGAFVVGSQARSSLTGVAGHQLGVQVELTPAGALALFGAVAELNDAVVPLDEALGATRGTPGRAVGRDADVGGAAAAPRRGPGRRRRPRALARGGVAARGSWLRRDGQARVEPLMDETGWSRRHVTERFRRQLGLSPKAYARLLRFEHATSLLNRPATRLHPGRGGGGGRLLRPVAPQPRLRRPGRHDPGCLCRRREHGARGQVCPRRGEPRAAQSEAMTTTHDTTTKTGRHPRARLRGHRGGPRLPGRHVRIHVGGPPPARRRDRRARRGAQRRRRHLAAPGDGRARDGLAPPDGQSHGGLPCRRRRRLTGA